MARRRIIEIDSERCDGCGQCALSCAEGAIEIRDGKATVVSDVFCDGLGACIGDCPRGALRIIEREAVGFDEDAVREHLASRPAKDACGCPSANPRELRMAPASATDPYGCASSEPRETAGGRDHDGCDCPGHGHPQASTLRQWPVQMRLVPQGGSFYAGKPLAVLADCAAVALPELHRDVVDGSVVAMACPKFEDGVWLRAKLVSILRDGRPSEVRVVHMEVPCCSALAKAVGDALASAGSGLAARRFVVGVEGGMDES